MADIVTPATENIENQPKDANVGDTTETDAPKKPEVTEHVVDEAGDKTEKKDLGEDETTEVSRKRRSEGESHPDGEEEPIESKRVKTNDVEEVPAENGTAKSDESVTTKKVEGEVAESDKVAA
jgi:hypothetical protein